MYPNLPPVASMTSMKCLHLKLKIRKHRKNPYPCLHCLSCKDTWSDPIRILSFLKKFKRIEGYKK